MHVDAHYFFTACTGQPHIITSNITHELRCTLQNIQFKQQAQQEPRVQWSPDND